MRVEYPLILAPDYPRDERCHLATPGPLAALLFGGDTQ
jgi:hypothetical protein